MISEILGVIVWIAIVISTVTVFGFLARRDKWAMLGAITLVGTVLQVLNPIL